MKGIKEQSITFLNSKKEKLWGVLSSPSQDGKFPAVIICHGYNQTKSYRFLVQLSRALASNGFASLRFDFAGCGESEGLLENTSISVQLADLEAAHGFFRSCPGINKDKIVLVGHSLGALIVLLLHVKLSSKNPLILIVPALNQRELIPTWYSEEQISACLRQGYVDTIKGRIGAGYIREAIEQDWLEKASLVKGPTLVLHGTKDDDVPLKCAKETFTKLPEPKKFVKIEDTDYKFRNIRHQKMLANAVLSWLKEHK